MIDVDKLSDAELRTKLLEFGFPVMPITGTTRKVMTKKLKLLLENKNKVGSSDGRRSLGRYSSEEESDADVKGNKKDRNRRATMAAPVSSTTTKSTRKIVVEPEVISSSPKKREIKSTTTTTTSRSQRLVKTAQDDFDTGSDSESDVVASSNKYNSSQKRDDSFNDVEFKKRASPIKSTLSSSYSRYSPSKNDDLSYTTTRNSSFAASASPSRYSASVGGSLASEYAADRLNQIRSRLSLGSPGYDKPYSTSTDNVSLEEKDTPFLSNFTKRLSSLSAAKKADFDSRNDMVKEHDTNGSSLYTKSYLSNFKSSRNREPVYDYKTRDNSGKSNIVSYAVLAAFAVFFVFLGVVYLGMKSDTSMVASDFISPSCDLPQSKIGVNCIKPSQAKTARDLLEILKPILYERAIDHKCSDPSVKPQMTEEQIVLYFIERYAVKEPDVVLNDVRNLELLSFFNPKWGLSVAQTDKSDDVVLEGNIAKNMEEVVFHRDKKFTSLLIRNPDLPYKCSLYNFFANAMSTIMLLGILFASLYVFGLAFKMFRKYQQVQKNEVNNMVEKIIDILQTAATEDSDEKYVVINHVRDMILSVKDRKAKQKYWKDAVQYINENESRVRTEVQTVHGESFDVWRWIGSSNLSMSGDTTDYKYRPGRRIVDVEYLIGHILQFPHRALFFCSSKNLEIKNEVREGFISIYLLKCKRCKKEYPVCSEEPKSELLNVNLAIVAGIVSLGLDLYQLNELCASVHVPKITGREFDGYLNEIRDIYNESKTDDGDGSFVTAELTSSTPKKSDLDSSFDKIFDAIEEVQSSIVPLDFEERKSVFLKELERDLESIEVFTRSQSGSELWINERKKRLTASNFGRICKLLDKTNRKNVVKDLLYSTFKGNAATLYGQENEDRAIRQFETATGKKVLKSGLVVHKDYPFLAASPDGLVENENALVEIKCPYKARDSINLQEAFDSKYIQFATFSDGALKLKRDDKYYYQIQGQLHITGKQYCYFIVWTPKDFACEVIEKDEEYWDKMFPRLEEFYFKHLLPEILNQTV